MPARAPDPPTHDHDHHHHAQHTPARDADEAYRRAYDGAQPDSGRKVVHVTLEARECDWTYAPGKTVRGWGYNGQVPGPVIEAQVGDVLHHASGMMAHFDVAR